MRNLLIRTALYTLGVVGVIAFVVTEIVTGRWPKERPARRP